MKSNIYIYNYNNYFNRIVKKESSLSNYGTPVYSKEDVNFDYNDGVTTSHVFNYTGEGNYLIVCDSNNNILHRWFIIENQKTRGGQYLLTLKRDLMVDYYDIVINAPMIVNRAWIADDTNPLLFNSEGFSFNQIKKDEILLKDSVGIPWYILYFKKDAASAAETARSGSYAKGSTNYDVLIDTTIANSIYAAGVKKYVSNLSATIKYRTDANDWAWSYFTDLYDMNISEDGISHTFNSHSSLTSVIWFNNSADSCRSELNRVFANSYNTISTDILTDTGNSAVITDNEYQTLNNIGSNGLLVKDSDGRIYRVTVDKGILPQSGNLTSGTTKNYVEGLINTTSLDRSDHFGDNTLNYDYNLTELTVTVNEITTANVNWVLWPNGTVQKSRTTDSAFDIIAIPYSDIPVWPTSAGYTRISGYDGKLLVDSISQKMGDLLVDIQLIPYCPLPIVSGLRKIELEDAPQSNYQALYYNNVASAYIFYLPNANFTFNINQSLTVKSIAGKSSAIANKVDNECNLYKIVSPNYNGSFEFSVSKNKGVDYFNVDVTLIPYNPYIHINPNFKGLYGTDWNDSKGLICGGDFSLPRYTDQFAQYELNNKNYQMIFDRQVRNLDFKQKQERVGQWAQMLTGTATGAGAGMLAGSYIGGPAGMAVGGTIGGVASLAGGAIDTWMMYDRQAEERSYMLDMYDYQLGNIKALPDTINKVTPLTFNHKMYPFIEVYSATDEEKNILMNYLDWRSMKVEAPGSIQTYLQSEPHFIQGELLRLTDFNESSFEAMEIYKEIKEGVYI